MKLQLFFAWTVLGVWMTCPHPGRAWDYPGHRIVNQLALATLPPDFPEFVKTAEARERIAFLGGEADRWRNAPDLAFRHVNGPDHFLDIDDLELYQLTPGTVSPFRYEFVAQLARARAGNPNNFPAIDPAKNADHTRNLIGFLPWTINEHYAKLKSCFSCLRTFEKQGGTSEEIANMRQNIIYLMGVMGHFVADASQPLHTTKHYNGWVGSNPKGYTTERRFHAWIDEGFIEKAKIKLGDLLPKIRPARLLAPDHTPEAAFHMFPIIMDFLMEQFRLVEPLYQLEKAGKLSADPEIDAEGREFIAGQLLKSGQMLGNLWLTAWRVAPGDHFLENRLSQRKAALLKEKGEGN